MPDVVGKQQRQSCWDPSVGGEDCGPGWGAKWRGNKAQTMTEWLKFDQGWCHACGRWKSWDWKLKYWGVKWARAGPGGWEYSWDCRRLKDKRALNFTRADRANANHEEGRGSECRNSWCQVQLLRIRPERINELNPGCDRQLEHQEYGGWFLSSGTA